MYLVYNEQGLGEEKKSRPNTKDQKEEKPSSPKKAVTSSQPLQSEVFDSSSDNAISVMKVADMRPDETSKVFLHVDGNQQLDPLLQVSMILKKSRF